MAPPIVLIQSSGFVLRIHKTVSNPKASTVPMNANIKKLKCPRNRYKLVLTYSFALRGCDPPEAYLADKKRGRVKNENSFFTRPAVFHYSNSIMILWFVGYLVACIII